MLNVNWMLENTRFLIITKCIILKVISCPAVIHAHTYIVRCTELDITLQVYKRVCWLKLVFRMNMLILMVKIRVRLL